MEGELELERLSGCRARMTSQSGGFLQEQKGIRCHLYTSVAFLDERKQLDDFIDAALGVFWFRWDEIVDESDQYLSGSPFPTIDAYDIRTTSCWVSSVRFQASMALVAGCYLERWLVFSYFVSYQERKHRTFRSRLSVTQKRDRPNLTEEALE